VPVPSLPISRPRQMAISRPQKPVTSRPQKVLISRPALIARAISRPPLGPLALTRPWFRSVPMAHQASRRAEETRTREFLWLTLSRQPPDHERRRAERGARCHEVEQ